MTTEQQNKAWACLPKDVRDEITDTIYGITVVDDFHKGYHQALNDFFGSHNLTSNTEPEEMLMVERKRVQEMYDYNDDILVTDPTHKGAKLLAAKLKELFGDKCLPDKSIEERAKELVDVVKDSIENPLQLPETMLYPKPQPKFKVGDKVKIVNVPNPMMLNEIGIIKEHLTRNSRLYKVKWCEDSESLIEDCYLEPYTEEKGNNTEKQGNNSKIPNPPQNPTQNCNNENHTSNSDNMEEKELNLCELLSCDSNLLESEFYSPAFGKVTLSEVRPSEREVVIMDLATSIEYSLNPFGCLLSSPLGYCILFPSRALYEKYPLDAKKAWQEWAESRKPKHTFVVKVFVGEENSVGECTINEHFTFRTKEEAQQAAEEVRKCLEQFHKRKEGEK